MAPSLPRRQTSYFLYPVPYEDAPCVFFLDLGDHSRRVAPEKQRGRVLVSLFTQTAYLPPIVAASSSNPGIVNGLIGDSRDLACTNWTWINCILHEQKILRRMLTYLHHKMYVRSSLTHCPPFPSANEVSWLLPKEEGLVTIAGNGFSHFRGPLDPIQHSSPSTSATKA